MSEPAPVPAARRASLWLTALAMVFAVGFESVEPPAVAWVWPAALAAAGAVALAWRDPCRNWRRTVILLVYLVAVLHVTRIDGDTGDAHVVELALALGIGCLVVPALAARWWLREPLDYHWWNGRWSARMIAWLGAGFVIAFAALWTYFNVLTPTLHHSWPLPPPDHPSRTEEMWRLFWGCNLVGLWDELCFINVVFVLLRRHFGLSEANAAQAVFFTSFLYTMAFRGWGPVVIGAFALIQGYTYERTRSLLYIVVLHLMIDSVLFYMIADRWYPGWGWHPG